MDLDGLGIQLQAFLLVDEELLHILTLVTLQLNHLAHLGVVDNGAIAGEFLLDHLEDLLLVELLRQALHRGQGLAAIALLDTDVDIILRSLFGVGLIVLRFGERVWVVGVSR